MAQRITLEIDGTEKFIGLLEGGVLQIERSNKKHFYRKLNAYGMDKGVLEHLQTLSCTSIQLHEKETGDVYETTLEQFLRKGLPNHYQGHGAQLFLPLRRWTKI